MTSSVGEERTLPPKGRVPREQRERQLIEVAERVFALHGFEAASMEEIAREGGVDRALVYQYFAGKRGLYEACVSSAISDLQARVSAAVANLSSSSDDDTRDAISRTGVRVFFEFVQDRGAAWDVLFSAGWSVESTADANRPAVDMLQFVVNLISITYGDAPQERIRATASALLGASWAVSLWWRNQSDMTLDEITDQHVEFCMSALEPLRVAAPS